MKRSAAALGGAAFLFLAGCAGVVPGASAQASGDRRSLAHGADISWFTQLEDRGVTWVDAAGVEGDLPTILKARGLDSIRLRVMVNPGATQYQATGSLLGYCDEAGVVEMAQRCYAAGFRRFLIDFHFSDTWADPSHQNVPAAWEGHNLAALAQDVAAHVTSVLGALKLAGITPEWVQVGNEETSGILWGTAASGKVSGTTGWTSLATLLNAGYDAVKAVSPTTKVVVHLDRGGRNSLYRWWFDNYLAAGGKFDAIGVSFYPYWQPTDTVAMLKANLEDLVDRYGKDVMVAEIGGVFSQAAATKTLLTEVKAVVAGLPGGRGIGLFYWEPEAAPSVVGGYQLGAATVVSGTKLRLTSAIDGLAYASEEQP